MNIAILGATSHIAKGLITCFSKDPENHLHLFSRRPENVQAFLQKTLPAWTRFTLCEGYQTFHEGRFQAIINCVGVETRNSKDCDFTRYFSVTEDFDNLVIEYLKADHQDAIYFSMSSGAIYGRDFAEPASEASATTLHVNDLKREDYYGIARINAEAKHRAHHQLRIIDLRIFSYFSRFINLEDGYLVTDLVQAIRHSRPFITDNSDIVRDYLHREDLAAMIRLCMASGPMNTGLDLASASPVSKGEMVEYFAHKYGIRMEIRPQLPDSPATGVKRNYYAICNKAKALGYRPVHSSLDTLSTEIESILADHPAHSNRSTP